MAKYRYHSDGTLPQAGEIFVFGSNKAGVHGAGAAKIACREFGAVYGVGLGLTGNSYAIPTKDRFIRTISLAEIEGYVNEFIDFSRDNPCTDFFVTAVGCGLAGYRAEQIAPLFAQCSANCSLPDTWKPFLG